MISPQFSCKLKLKSIRRLETFKHALIDLRFDDQGSQSLMSANVNETQHEIIRIAFMKKRNC